MKALIGLVIILGVLIAGCGGGKADLIRLPDGDISENELRALIRSFVSDPATAGFMCPEYRGTSDDEVMNIVRGAAEIGAEKRYPVASISDEDFRRKGVIWREECERVE